MKIKSIAPLIDASIMFLLSNQLTAQADSSRDSTCLTHVPLSEESGLEDGGSKFSAVMHKGK